MLMAGEKLHSFDETYELAKDTFSKELSKEWVKTYRAIIRGVS